VILNEYRVLKDVATNSNERRAPFKLRETFSEEIVVLPIHQTSDDGAVVLEGKEIFISMMESNDPTENPVTIGEVISEEVDGDKATLRISRDGEESDIQLVKENGKWKISLELL
jgi:hypothetical protein